MVFASARVAGLSLVGRARASAPAKGADRAR
jgi:hypothetical protein